MSNDELAKAEFAKEPRIIELFVKNVSGKYVPVITFSDKSVIELNDLSPETLAKVKVQFDDKMAQLVAAATNSMKPC